MSILVSERNWIVFEIRPRHQTVKERDRYQYQRAVLKPSLAVILLGERVSPEAYGVCPTRLVV